MTAVGSVPPEQRITIQEIVNNNPAAVQHAVQVFLEKYRTNFRLPQRPCNRSPQSTEEDGSADKRNELTREDCVACDIPKDQHSTMPPIKAPAYSGHLNFYEEGHYRTMKGTAEFLRVGNYKEDENGIKLVAEIMFKIWKIPIPPLIIEVTGSAAIDEMISPDYQPVVKLLKEDIVLAAEKANALIVTGGTTGVMRWIGDEACRKRLLGKSINCLGVTTWGIIKNKHLLDSNDGSYVEVDYNIDHTREFLSPLNSGHNYYLFVDDGTHKMYGKEISFRKYLLKHVTGHYKHEGEGIQTVLISIGGGPGTLQTLEDAFSRNTPVVIVTGFAGASDILAAVLDFLDEKERDVISKEAHAAEQLCNRPSTYRLVANYIQKQERTRSQPEERHQRCIEEIKKYYKFAMKAKLRNLVTVVDTHGVKINHSAHPLHRAIVNACFKAKSSNIDDTPARPEISAGTHDRTDHASNEPLANIPALLKIARRWNVEQSAQMMLQKLKNKDVQRLRKNALYRQNFLEIIQEAVIHGQADFVDTLLHYGIVQRSEFLERDSICNIFEKALAPHQGNTLGAERLRKRILLLPNKNEIASQFCCCYYYVGCCQGQCNLPTDYNNNLSEKTGAQISDQIGAQFSDHVGCFQSNLFKDGYRGSRNIFLLQLLLGNKELAVYLWRTGENILGTALMASLFLSSLVNHAKHNNLYELAAEYKEGAKLWERRAFDLLNKCNELHTSKVTWLLTRNLESWQNRSVMDITYYGRLKGFAENSVVQTKLNHVWHGRILSQTKTLLIFACIFCFPALFAVKFIGSDISSKTPWKKLPAEQTTEEKNKAKNSAHQKMDYDSAKPFKPLRPTAKSCSDHNGEVLPFCQALFQFYFFTPLVRFMVYLLFAAAFLFLFASFLLVGNLEVPIGQNAHELCVVLISLCMLVDFIHEAYAEGIAIMFNLKDEKLRTFNRACLFGKINIFKWQTLDFNDFWFPFATFLLLSISIWLRVSQQYIQQRTDIIPMYYPRTAYALTCLLFWIRSAKVFSASRKIGVISVILSNLIPTVTYFVVIYAFLLLSFSVPIFALYAPTVSNSTSLNQATLFANLMAKVVYNRWWNLVQFKADNSLDMVEGQCPEKSSSFAALPLCTDGDDSRPVEFNVFAIILYAIFIVLTNIAWMNVLIATLSQKVEKIWRDARKLSKFNYMIAVRMTYNRCFVPPPFSIIEIAIRMLVFACTKMCCKKSKEVTDFLEFYEDEAHEILDEMERDAADFVLQDETENEAEKKKGSGVIQEERQQGKREEEEADESSK